LAEQAPGQTKKVRLPETIEDDLVHNRNQPVLLPFAPARTDRPISPQIGLDTTYNRHNPSPAQIE
jgi:hypothetical protein